MTRQPTLTSRKRDILLYIRDFRRDQGYSPTLREMAIGCESTHPTVHEHVDYLVRHHLLSRAPFKARSLQLTRKALGLIRGKD